MTNREAKLLLFDIAGRTESQRERDALSLAFGAISEDAEDIRLLGATIRDVLERHASDVLVEALKKDATGTTFAVSDEVLTAVAVCLERR